jgi:hypothetical protein
MSNQRTPQVSDVHPMMPVNEDNYHECIEEYAEQLGQFMAKHPQYVRRFGPLYESLRALQTALRNTRLTTFETLLVQQVYGYHFHILANHPKDRNLLPQEVFRGLQGIALITFGLLWECTGLFRVISTKKAKSLPLLCELLSHLERAIGACAPKETQRLRQHLLPTVERLSHATMRLQDAREHQDALDEWCDAAEQYNLVFEEEFSKHYGFGRKGYHLIHEIDKGIFALLPEAKEALP